MKKTIIVLVIITILIVIALLWGIDVRQVNGPEATENEPNSQITETETSDWKTYRNEELGFEFMYPGKLTFSEKKATDFQKTNTGLKHTLNFSDNEISNVLTFNFFDNAGKLELGSWIEKYNPNSDTFETLKIDSYNARQYSKNSMGNPISNYVISKDDYILIINAIPNYPDVDKIVSSINFF